MLKDGLSKISSFVINALFGIMFCAHCTASHPNQNSQEFSFKGKQVQSLDLIDEVDRGIGILWKANEKVAEILVGQASDSLNYLLMDMMRSAELKKYFAGLFSANVNGGLSIVGIDAFFEISKDVFSMEMSTDTNGMGYYTILLQPTFSACYNSETASMVRGYVHKSPEFLNTVDSYISNGALNVLEIFKLTPIQLMVAKYLFLFPNQIIKPAGMISKPQLNYLQGLAKNLEVIEENVNSINTLTLIACNAHDGSLPFEVRSIIESYFLYFTVTKKQ